MERVRGGGGEGKGAYFRVEGEGLLLKLYGIHVSLNVYFPGLVLCCVCEVIFSKVWSNEFDIYQEK